MELIRYNGAIVIAEVAQIHMLYCIFFTFFKTAFQMVLIGYLRLPIQLEKLKKNYYNLRLQLPYHKRAR